MRIRNIDVDDYTNVIRVLDDWWGGRSMTHLLPRLFFEYFQPTSFIIEDEEQLVGFLIGFISQTEPKEAYIHFVGINPNHRKQGFANDLYQLFFETVKEIGCERIRCITTPANMGSIAFHIAMGFEARLIKDYASKGQDRIMFFKYL